MKIKLKTQSLDDWELNLFESYSTLPIIIGRTMIFGAYNVDFEMTDNIWHQLPEEYKKKIYKYNLKKLIKSMLITVTDITAYSFCFGCNVKLKKSLIMEEIYEDFDENKKIEFLTPGCDFPDSSMSVYFHKYMYMQILLTPTSRWSISLGRLVYLASSLQNAVRSHLRLHLY